MGLFSFLKGKGKNLGAAEASEAPSADTLKQEVKDLGLDDQGIDIAVEGDTVKLSGKAVDQETKEKMIVAVGNIQGVATVEDETEGNDPTLHTVESGDTLWAIAEKTLGSGSRYMEIFEANKPMLSDPDKIYPGQVLRIPAA
ncbi:peptidoglycan-binding protein LysM [Tropicimonas isoalkanivorans]|uniref:BON domain-containing protein n=1 Tax=Tropicimonas isoalkanivorans TaxID=441112 RepID=A0A1I1RE81_9RHOB|nr:peptidoglycan-binding protein LysM [Tropicimonas isoalkanivorans]SFD28700.1 BON domain-containing protein [Tropicimonas isoalkanivorans]